MTTERNGEDDAGPSPDERRSLPGNQTMQLDAISEEIFEELDARYPEPVAAPPPLPPRRRWTPKAVAALVGVIMVAALLALAASRWLFSGDDAEVAAPTHAPTPEDPPEVIPLQLDEVVIESGGDDESPPAE